MVRVRKLITTQVLVVKRLTALDMTWVTFTTLIKMQTATNDFAELYGSVTMSGVTAGIASEVYTQGGTDFDQTYYSLSSDFELTDGFGLTATAGRYNRDGSDDYSHLTFDVTKDDFTFSLSKATSGSGDDSVIPYVSYSKTF